MIHTTDTHPWYTADHGWLPANFLRVGERVVRVDGSTAVVVGVRAVAGAAAMWDLTVSNVHTFAVGNDQFVVHNCDRVNFGSDKSEIDWDHIKRNHMEGGEGAAQSGKKDIFHGLDMDQVKRVVRGAWRNRVKDGAQQVDLVTGEVRNRWLGKFDGWTVRGYFNQTRDIVESAWPVFLE